MTRSDTSPADGRTDGTGPGDPYRTRRNVGFALGAAGLAAALAGGWIWAFAIVSWIAAVLLIAVRPSPEEQVARGLGAVRDLEKIDPGAWAFRVQWGESAFAVFESIEAAGSMAKRLVRMNEAPTSAGPSTEPPSPIQCFQSLIWPEIGPIPVRSWVWNREAGDWVETWSGSASAAAAAVAHRKRRLAQEAAAAAAAQAAARITPRRPSSWP